MILRETAKGTHNKISPCLKASKIGPCLKASKVIMSKLLQLKSEIKTMLTETYIPSTSKDEVVNAAIVRNQLSMLLNVVERNLELLMNSKDC
ncbi:hypothetical protein AAMO2058_001637700 [Amorphochlora amoebiformis]